MSIARFPITPPTIPDPHTRLKTELVGLQIETWLLEARAADVRRRLRHCRLRRDGLGRDYRRAVATTSTTTVPEVLNRFFSVAMNTNA